MFISHFDNDHVDGILSLMKEIKIKNIIICKQGENSENYKEFVKLVNQKKIKVKIAEKGERIKIEKDVYFDIIWPEKELISENVLNNNSLVIKMAYNEFSMLFTGDIEEIAEKKILSKVDKQKLKSTVLKVAHHGSNTSSIREFIDAVKPQIALIGVGENNMYGHPSDEVISRLQSFGTKIYRTDECGEITIEVNKNGKIIDINKYKNS